MCMLNLKMLFGPLASKAKFFKQKVDKWEELKRNDRTKKCIWKRQNFKKCKAVKFVTLAPREQYANQFHSESESSDVKRWFFQSILSLNSSTDPSKNSIQI